jgi:hypothetical protein
MTIVRDERIALFANVIDAASKTVRSPHFSCEYADFAVVLIEVTETGSPSGSESVTVYVMQVDSDDHEYIDANATYGTISITGSDAPINKAVVVPYLADNIAVKAVGAGSLSSSTSFTITVRLVLVGNTDFPAEYQT